MRLTCLVALSAFFGLGGSTAKPEEVVKPQGSANLESKSLPLVPPKRWALVIGAGNYDSLGALRYAPADAKAFAKALVDDFRFQPESVLRLTDENEDTRPTVANIRKSLDTVLADPRLNKGDLFVFYFSGHGVGTPKGDYLCPTDATVENVASVGLPIKEVLERFVKAGLKNVLILADACRGGEKNSFGAELNRLGAEANIGVMLGCEPGSRSYQWTRAGHGYFTYYLLEALKKPELRQTGSGALWASEIGKWLAWKVSEATKTSFDKPQVPAIECDDRRDIMMGAFLPAAVEESVVKVLKERTEQMTPERQAASLSDYASRLFEEERFFDCAEIYRVVDGLGRAEDADQLLLATSLTFIGRTSEASRIFDRLQKSENAVYRSMAVILDERNTDYKSKTEAARVLINGIDSPSATLGFLGLLGSPGTNPYRADLVREVLKGPAAKERLKFFLEADLAFESGNLGEAEELLRKSLVTFGLVPDSGFIRLKLGNVLKARNDFAGYVKLCDEAISLGEQVTAWRLGKAATLRLYLNKRDEAAAEIGIAAKGDLTPSQLVDCLSIAGRRAEAFADDLKRNCDRHPRAWEAHVCRFLINALVEGDIVADLPADDPAFRYADDPIMVAKGFELAFQAIWTDWVDESSIPADLYRDLMILRSGRLLKILPRAGDDVDLWWHATVNGIRAFRSPQLLTIYKAKFGPALAANTISSTHRAHFAIVAFNAADFETFDMVTKQGLMGGDQQNIAWLRALTLVIRGRDDEVAKLVPTLKPPTVDYSSMSDALKIYAQTFGMKEDEARKLLTAAKTEDPTARALIGLAWLRLGDLEAASPLLEDSISMMNWAFQALHAHALAKLGESERKQGNDDTADIVTFWLQMSQPGQPSLAALQYGSSPNLDGLKGDYSFTGRQVNDDTTITPTTATWSIDPTGALKGTLGSNLITGKVDAKGNFMGTAKVGGQVWQATAKLAPRKTYLEMEQFKQEAQVVVLLSPKGERLIYALKPVQK